MKKGFTLVEVIVSLTIFMMTFFTIYSTYLLANKAYVKEKEYLEFENICYEIDYHYDNDILDSYFSDYLVDNICYYDEDFNLTKDNNARYKLEINQADGFYLTISNQENNYIIIDNLYYGVSKDV